MIFVAVLMLLAPALSGCRHRHDARLEHAAAMLTGSVGKASADSAMSLLTSIPADALSEADRHYRDLLTVKAADKAYRKHTSDSLILDVIAYYERHQSVIHYPEALYYGGRVYSDMGNSPEALKYFQKAADELPADDTDNDSRDLRSRVVSQTGRLLNKMRLYDEAITYICESISVTEQLHDTLGIVQNLQLLGGIYMKAEKYDSAEIAFGDAMRLGHNMSPSLNAKSQMYLANIKYKKGAIDSAKFLINGLYGRVDSLVRNNVLCYATAIYLKSGMIERAYQNADSLIHSPHNFQKNIGYHYILSPELRQYVPEDSVVKYTYAYRELLDAYYDEDASQFAVIQQAMYNYRQHDRQRAEAQELTRKWEWIGAIMAILLLAITVTLLWIRNRSKERLIQLQNALERISNKQEPSPTSEETCTGKPMLNVAGANSAEEAIRIKILERLNAYYEACGGHVEIPRTLTESEAYRKLQRIVLERKILRDDNELWKNLEEAIQISSPDFIENLKVLSGGKVKKTEWQTVILIKCGLTTSQMAHLLCLTYGAIGSRRDYLGKKLFREKKGADYTCGIIRLI